MWATWATGLGCSGFQLAAWAHRKNGEAQRTGNSRVKQDSAVRRQDDGVLSGMAIRMEDKLGPGLRPIVFLWLL